MSRIPASLARTLVVLAMVGAAVPASAEADRANAALAQARENARRLIARANSIRADLASGSFVKVVERLATMADVGVSSPVAPARVAVAGLPAAIAAPVADLLSAANDAAARVRAAVEADGGSWEARARRSDQVGRSLAYDLVRGRRLRTDEAVALKTRVTADPILRAAASGALSIARALDRSLAPLIRAASSLERTGTSTPGCDLVDQAPLLCVSGPDVSANSKEAVLTVDLGGDDTYTSSAGGANSARCTDDPDDTSCNASIVVDVAGNDTYSIGDEIVHDHLVGGGSAMTGIGMLVDVSGDDRYLAKVTRTETIDLSFIFGAANYGVGLLADLTGDDRYEVEAEPVFFNPYTHGASLDGMGGLIDLGGTNLYRISQVGPQRPSLENPLRANRSASSFGTGIFGGAALVDATGNAKLESVIDATAGDQRDANRVNPIAHGVGLIGQGAVFAGPGATTYRAIARRVASADIAGQSEEPPVDELEGYEFPAARLAGGATSTGVAVSVLGLGIVQDLGGDDEYTNTARSEHHLRVTAEEGCHCDRAIATLDLVGWDTLSGWWTDPSNANVSAQGVGSSFLAPDAGSLLHDVSGNDTYTARAEMVVDTHAVDRIGTATGARAASVPSWFTTMTAFGQGIGSDGAPTILQDEAGNDDYDLTVDARFSAVAEGVAEEKASALAPPVANHGQGTSYFDPAQGALLDLGGTDSYTARAVTRANTDPAPGAIDMSRTIASQGGVGGVLADLDQGLQDSFSASPERVARVGQRGEGPGWVDISQTFPGFGFAPLQPAKRDVAMSMDPANPSSSTGGWVPLRARVTDAGQPVAGAEVVFTLESSLPALGGDLTWSAREERTHAFTDENGWASAQLFVEEIDEPSDEQLRIAASYAGDTQRRTASAAQPFYLR